MFIWKISIILIWQKLVRVFHAIKTKLPSPSLHLFCSLNTNNLLTFNFRASRVWIFQTFPRFLPNHDGCSEMASIFLGHFLIFNLKPLIFWQATRDTWSASILQKQDEPIHIYVIKKTVCFLGYPHNGFVVDYALGHTMYS